MDQQYEGHRQRQQYHRSCEAEPDYITQLESRLRLLEEHHRGCKLNTLIQSPPASPNSTDEEPDIDTAPIPLRAPQTPSVAFIQWELPAVQDALRNSERPRWKQEADILLKEIPEATKWMDVWKKYQGQDVITTVLGDPIPGSGSNATSSASAALVCRDRPCQDDLLMRVSRYAERVKSCGAAAKAYTHIASFQELVFVSLCHILVEYGIDTDVVDDIMRICISDSSSKNLKRLRAGALWVNKLINRLQWSGWYQRATMVFILRKNPPFWTYPSNGK